MKLPLMYFLSTSLCWRLLAYIYMGEDHKREGEEVRIQWGTV
jgi:hypothetical protein